MNERLFHEWILGYRKFEEVEEYIHLKLAQTKNRGKVIDKKMKDDFMELQRTLLWPDQAEVIPKVIEGKLVSRAHAWGRLMEYERKELDKIVDKWVVMRVTDTDGRALGKKLSNKIDDLKWEIKEFFEDRKEGNYATYSVHNIEEEINKFTLFSKHTVQWYPWDMSFNVELLADAIERSAKYTKKHGMHVGKEKDYRRMMCAVGLLRQSMDPPESMGHKYLSERVDYGFEESGFKVTYKSKNPERLEKIWDKEVKRHMGLEQVYRQRAFKYLARYGYWWD